METFTFKNISSDTLGIIVKELNLVPKSARNIESISIDGRNGSLHIDNKNYLSKSYTIPCVLLNTDHLDDILSLFNGSGKLTLSKYPGRYFNATIKNQIDFKTYLTVLNEFPLQFELDPISYSNDLTTETITENSSITVGGDVEVFPIITITGTGTLTVNGYPMEISETGITVDCDLMQCYKQSTAKNDKVVLDEFPRLKPGTNNIVMTSGITSVSISYHEGWL